MFENKDTLIQAMRKPMNIASMALDEIQERMGGTKIIADPNSPFCHLLEFGSSVAAMCAQAIDEKYPQIYPQRAKSMEDLYQHMSDFDYLRMYSSPSQTTIRLAIPKKYLIDNALPYNTNYKKLTIQKDTVFMVGRYPFGIYYPIDILINNFTKTFTVVYDTKETNPLHVLTKNIVDKYDFSYHAIDYLVIDFPIYQFAKSTTTKSVVVNAGFAEKIIYNDKFYAVRLYNYKDGKYTELGQSQSKIVYDVEKPTALIRVLPDEHKLQITIPQVYLDEGMIGSKILVEMYTTLGAMDIDTANIDPNSIQINFSKKTKDTTDYSAIFKNLPFDYIRKLSSPKITGGSDAISVDTLRDRVVNDTLYDKVPISAEEIQVYLEDNSFHCKKYLDNVTDRIYYAYRILEDGDGAVIPSISLNMRMLSDYVLDRAAFIEQSDKSITILPTALYRYQSETDDVVPLTDVEMTEISNMEKPELVETLNNHQYLKSPFHMRINLSDYYPEAISFNLMTPEIKRIIFVTENYNVSAKMTTFDATIEHQNDGVGGYKVRLSVFKSDDLKEVDRSNLHLYIVTKTITGYWVGIEAQYEESTELRDIYAFEIKTNYHLTDNNQIAITNFQGDGLTLSEHMISLEQDFHIVHMVDKSAVVGEYEDAPAQVVQGVPTSMLVNNVGVSRQYLTLHLGHSLKDVIKNNVEASSTREQYAVWEEDIPAVYEEDVYKRDAEGVPVLEEVDGSFQLVKLASKGDVVRNEAGQIVYLHHKGDVKYGMNGPITVVDREHLYYIDMILIDAKVFASERQAELSFVKNMYLTMEGYFDIIRNLQDQLLERTELYFKCVRSTGTAKFNMGDGLITTQNIEMSFAINCYVPSYVKQDEDIQAVIKSKVCEVIEENIKTQTISMLDIFDSVKAQLSDYIDHFTLLGINGSVSNQTFKIESEDAQPSVARRLTLTEDNIISLDKSVDIQFIALSDNTSGSVTYAK